MPCRIQQPHVCQWDLEPLLEERPGQLLGCSASLGGVLSYPWVGWVPACRDGLDWHMFVFPMAVGITHSIQAHSLLVSVGLLLLHPAPHLCHLCWLFCCFWKFVYSFLSQDVLSALLPPTLIYQTLALTEIYLKTHSPYPQCLLSSPWISKTPNKFSLDTYSVYTDWSSRISWLKVSGLEPDSTGSCSDPILTRNIFISDCCYEVKV